MGWIGQALNKRSSHFITGLYASVGTPTKIDASGNVTFGFGGQDFSFHPDSPIKSLAPVAGSTGWSTPWQKLGGAFELSQFIIPGPVMGFMQGGVKGALRNTVLETSLQASILKHAYTAIENKAGEQILHMGRPLGGGARATKFLLNRGIRGTAGFLDMQHRYLVGSWAAYGATSLFGGGPLGLTAGMFAGNMAIAHTGKITAMLLGAKAVQLAGRGTYALLKAGYNFKQRQTMVQTDGDMAAFNTAGAFTMRARAVQAIQKSHLNARTALGQEATYLSYPQRSYSSPYRRFY